MVDLGTIALIDGSDDDTDGDTVPDQVAFTLNGDSVTTARLGAANVNAAVDNIPLLWTQKMFNVVDFTQGNSPEVDLSSTSADRAEYCRIVCQRMVNASEVLFFVKDVPEVISQNIIGSIIPYLPLQNQPSSNQTAFV